MSEQPSDSKFGDESAAMVLALAVSAIVSGVLAFWYSIETFGMGIVVLGPAIGVCMLIAAIVCFRWLYRMDTRQENAALLVSARIASGLTMLLGFLAAGFLLMGGAGIYK